MQEKTEERFHCAKTARDLAALEMTGAERRSKLRQGKGGGKPPQSATKGGRRGAAPLQEKNAGLKTGAYKYKSAGLKAAATFGRAR